MAPEWCNTKVFIHHPIIMSLGGKRRLCYLDEKDGVLCPLSVQQSDVRQSMSSCLRKKVDNKFSV